VQAACQDQSTDDSGTNPCPKCKKFFGRRGPGSFRAERV